MSTARFKEPIDLGRLTRQAQNTRMFQEAQEASVVAARQILANAEVNRRLGRELRESPPSLVVTCARGSSDHAATYAKYLIETRIGVTTASAAPSVQSVYAERAGPENALFLAISQSGKSPDLLATAQNAKRAGALVVGMVNVETSSLALLADVALPLKAGPELSVAATKSYIAALAAVLHLVAHWAEADESLNSLADLPDLLAKAWTLDWTAGVKGLAEAQSLFVLGRGLGLGIAQEMALKFKETCSIHAEAFSTAEVRHGPMTIIGKGFPVLIIGQDDESLPGVRETAAEMVARGARVFCAGFETEGATTLPWLAADPAIQPLLLVQSFYRMNCLIALARGLDPDRPPHLSKVTETR